ncbi:TetR/AcrR family transcriptional regulator [Streptomyces boninensis]|uniref:TetR/AcrR family transcriptional regulator n=1 Tax=Streptomyces boninensis TaxID=2039455 RepID=UPI003B210F0E
MTLQDRHDAWHERHPKAPRRRGRPRSEAAERAIIEGVLHLLEEGAAIGDLTMERIARTAGVGKATIYRRWAGRDELLVDVLASLEPPLQEPEGETVRDVLVACLESIRQRALTKRASAALRMAMTQAQQHPQLAKKYHETVIGPRRALLRQVIERGVAAGELRADLDVELLMELFAGPMLSRAVLHEWAPLDDDLPAQIVDAVLDGVRPRAR